MRKNLVHQRVAELEACKFLEINYGTGDIKQPATNWMFRRAPSSGGWSKNHAAGDLVSPYWFPIHVEAKYDQVIKIDQFYFIGSLDKCMPIRWMKQSIRDCNAHNLNRVKAVKHGEIDRGQEGFRFPSVWVRMDRRDMQIIMFWNHLYVMLNKAGRRWDNGVQSFLLFHREEFRHDLYGPLVMFHMRSFALMFPDKNSLKKVRLDGSEILFNRS